jgi:hypothetical protein
MAHPLAAESPYIWMTSLIDVGDGDPVATWPFVANGVDITAISQASTSAGTITFIGAVGTITIPASVTNAWDPGVYLWDLQGVVSGATPAVYTLDSGNLTVTGDITRAIV